MTRAIVLAAAVLASTGCGVPLMRPATPSEVYSAPPAGKTLVNFHRPSNYGGNRLYTVFDRTKFLGNDFGEQRFQYVCDPGEHIFIGFLRGSIWGSVSVIKADLQPDKIYDCIVDAGFFTSSIAINPIKKGEERREDFPDWEDDQRVFVVDDAQNVSGFEAKRQEDNEKIMADFVNGEKKDRLKYLDAADCR